MWNFDRITKNSLLLSLCAALVVAAGADLARAESTGGSIGNTEKTLSGSAQEPHSAGAERPAGRSRPARQTRRSSPQGGGGGGGGVARYDGNWTVVLSKGCQVSGTGSVAVSGGRISGMNLSGSVSPNGAFRASSSGGGLTINGAGRLTGNSGSGTYRQSDGCSGSIRVIKNG